MFTVRGLTRSLQIAAGGILLLFGGISEVFGVDATKEKVVVPTGWKEYHATAGNCSLFLPVEPEHISEKMAMPEGNFELKYDAYISPASEQTVFMLLVAQYPDFVDQAYAQMSLEGFLNGILTHNPGNQLIFADLLLVDGHEALDFFIRTGNVYFKGRAVMVNNSLYLMAMECEIPHYDEVRYKAFVDSFKLHQKVALKSQG